MKTNFYKTELELGHCRGWDREVERHQRTAERFRALLEELGEPEEVSGGE